MKLLLLAAGRGSRIFKNIKKNKCLISVYNKSLIKNIVYYSQKFKNIKEINCVVGFRKKNILEDLKNYKINFIENNKFLTTDMLYSAYLGIKKLKNDDVLLFYTDTYFSKKFVKFASKIKEKDICIPVSSIWKKIWKIRNKDLFDDGEELILNKRNLVLKIGQRLENKIPHNQYMGVIYFPKSKLNYVKKTMLACIKNKKKTHLTNYLQYLVDKKIKIKAIINKEFWYEIDDIEDYKNFKKKYAKN